MLRKYLLMVMVVCTFAIAKPCKAGNLYEDVKHFVLTNPHYRHGLTLASGIYSFLVFTNYLQKNQGRMDSKAQLALAFSGSYITSRIVQENPGYTTLAALAIILYSLLK